MRYHESFEQKGKLCIVMDFADSGTIPLVSSPIGDLHKRIREAKNRNTCLDESRVSLLLSSR
ncbi:MAG: hypothetical protein P4M11_02755 [Candidatus Pacebacteria bacterium]|nr:hypothetical protein [Candidatus Paceibacterota bacterium]